MTNDEDESEERLKIMTLGNTKVGKTSFIIKYTEDYFQEIYLSTIGIDFRVKDITIDEKVYKLLFYDTTGQEKYKSLALNVVKNIHGIILMYDITDKSSFESIPEWIQSLQDVKGNDFPMILLGNKIDKEEERIISNEDGEELAKEYNIDFLETSNKNGTNINEAVLAIVKKILESNQRDELNNISANSAKLSENNMVDNQKDNSKKCC